MQYFPLALPVLLFLFVIFIVLIILIEINVLKRGYATVYIHCKVKGGKCVVYYMIS